MDLVPLVSLDIIFGAFNVLSGPLLPQKKKIPIQVGTCKGVFNATFHTLPYNYCLSQFYHSTVFLLFPRHLSPCLVFSRCAFVIDQT